MKSGCRSCALAAASSSAFGDKPPQDHPHIYLKIGDASEIICPYRSTLSRFDPSLGEHQADPADRAYGDRDELKSSNAAAFAMPAAAN